MSPHCFFYRDKAIVKIHRIDEIRSFYFVMLVGFPLFRSRLASVLKKSTVMIHIGVRSVVGGAAIDEF